MDVTQNKQVGKVIIKGHVLRVALKELQSQSQSKEAVKEIGWEWL